MSAMMASLRMGRSAVAAKLQVRSISAEPRSSRLCPLGLFGLQLLFGKLADHRLRQGIAELDLGRHFDFGELAFEVAANVVRRRHGTRLELDKGFGGLAAVVVLDADDGRFLDRAMLIDRLLD